MLVDGVVRRICITPVDGVKEVARIPAGYHSATAVKAKGETRVRFTAPPWQLPEPVRQGWQPGMLSKHGVPNLVIDSNSNT